MRDRLAVFDMDGTLIDTLMINYESYRRALGEVGIDFALETYRDECFGRNYRDFLPQIVGGDEALSERVHVRKLELYAQCFDMGHVNEALKDFIISCRDRYYMVVGTTATRSSVEKILEHFGLMEYFDALYTQEDVTRYKPDPEIYLKIMSDYGIGAEHTVIFEDSKVGLEAALACGASVIKIEKF
ncbi:MAG: HAD family phosphatase [Lachnospiraceae bacterium]|nr:HAD family phosphatase [Lachnospiraceae bacterium]